MAFEAFMVTVAATGAGALDTADPAKAERLINGATPTNAYMVKVWGWGGGETGRGRADAMQRAAEEAGRGEDARSEKGGRRCLREWEADEWRRVMAAATTAKEKVAGRRLGDQTRPVAAEGRGPLDQPTPDGREGRAGALSASCRAPARWVWD